jgi:hypothetical protein
MQNNQEAEEFHTIDASSLKSITVEEILSGGGVDPEEIDYTVQVPTANQKITNSARDTWFQVQFGGIIQPVSEDETSKHRGTLGGC